MKKGIKVQLDLKDPNLFFYFIFKESCKFAEVLLIIYGTYGLQTEENVTAKSLGWILLCIIKDKIYIFPLISLQGYLYS